MPSPILGMTELVAEQASGEVTANTAHRTMEFFCAPKITDRNLTAPPGSPSDGDAYIIAASGSGDWSGHDGKIALYNSGWTIITPKGGMQVFVHDEKAWYGYSSAESLWHPMQDLWSATEHWTGKYSSGGEKLMSKYVALGALPNATTKNVAHGISSLQLGKPMVYQLNFGDTGVANGPIPVHLPSISITCEVTVNATNVVMTSATNLSAFTGFCRLEYCNT